MLFLFSAPISRRIQRFHSIISVLTSARGRFQFSISVSVRTSIPGGRMSPHVADRIDAGAMSLNPRKMTLRRPPPIPVHDHGDVRREPLEIDFPRQRFVG
jgi:hypothetical protein